MSNQQVAVRPSLALVPTDKRVVAVAVSLRWAPETLIARLESALPAKIEQQYYLLMAPDLGLQPESFAKLLRIGLGERELEAYDLEDKVVGTNMVFNRVSGLTGFLGDALTLLGKIVGDFKDIGLSMETAGRLALAYGAHSEAVISDVLENVEAIRENLRISDRVPQRSVAAVAIELVAEHASGNGTCSRPNALSVMELIGDPDGELANRLRQMLGDEEE